jgi:DNA polymerase lambda
VLRPLLARLRACRLLTDDLTLVEDGGQHKYMGVCQLRGSLHRRLDLLLGPYDEWPFLLLHFTGSGYLNRSMRAMAAHKVGCPVGGCPVQPHRVCSPCVVWVQGMHLSQHGLFVGVVREGTRRLTQGTRVPGIRTEEDIFRALGLTYLAPHDRNAD